MPCRLNLPNNLPPIPSFRSETRTLPSRPFQRPQTRPFLQPPRRHFSTTKCSLVDVEDRNIDDHVPPEPPTLSDNQKNIVKNYNFRPSTYTSPTRSDSQEHGINSVHFRPTHSSTSAPPTRSRPDEQSFSFAPASDPSPVPSRPFYDSTITASEQAVFNRIFADILSPNYRTASENTVKTNPAHDAECFADLDAIFNDALVALEKRTSNIKQRKAALATSRLIRTDRAIIKPKTIVERLLHDDGTAGFIQGAPAHQDVPSLSYETDDWNHRGKTGPDDVSNLREVHYQYRNKVNYLLDRAQTDVELWQILENEVFRLVRELDARIKRAEKTNQTKPRKATKARTALTSPPPSEGNQNLTKKPAAGKPSRIQQPMKPASLLPTPLLSIVQHEYSRYVNKTLRALQNFFPTSPLALQVLPTVRRLGPISYTLGATTKLYNRTMLSMWKQEGNLHAIADLLDEMFKNGVETDHVTLAFLTGLKRVRDNALAGHNGLWTKNWWSMANEEEGWRRVTQRMQKCQEEVMAQEAKMSREEKELDEKEQEQNK